MVLLNPTDDFETGSKLMKTINSKWKRKKRKLIQNEKVKQAMNQKNRNTKIIAGFTFCNQSNNQLTNQIESNKIKSINQTGAYEIEI